MAISDYIIIFELFLNNVILLFTDSTTNHSIAS